MVQQPSNATPATHRTDHLNEENYRLQERIDKAFVLHMIADVTPYGNTTDGALFELQLSLPLLPGVWLLIGGDGKDGVLMRVTDKEYLYVTGVGAGERSAIDVVVYITAHVLAHYARYADYHGHKINQLLQYIRRPPSERIRW